MKCDRCHNDFPHSDLSTMVINGQLEHLCPTCKNEELGSSKNEKSDTKGRNLNNRLLRSNYRHENITDKMLVELRRIQKDIHFISNVVLFFVILLVVGLILIIILR